MNLEAAPASPVAAPIGGSPPSNPPGDSLGPKSGRFSCYLRGLAILLLTFAACGNMVFNTYIWDDNQYVTDNKTLLDLQGLHDIWLVPLATPQYYPLVFTTFWMEQHLWGLWPAGYHFNNILIHAISSILLWRLLRRLEIPGAWLAAAIFAVHPVQVESVAWVTERKNTLSLLFYLASFLAYLRFSPPANDLPHKERDWRFYAVALALFVGALLSKTVTCSFPAAVLLVLWWKQGRISWRDAAALVPFFVVGLALGLHTAHLEKTHVMAEGEMWDFTLIERCLIAGNAVVFYAWKLVWPSNLSFIYPRWDISQSRSELYLAPIGAVVVLLGLFFARSRITRGPFAAFLFFVMTLFPALGFFNVYPFRFSFVADHFQYLASIGIIMLIAAVIATAIPRLCEKIGPELREKSQSVLGAVAGVILLSLSLNTFLQTFIYHDTESLWFDTVQKNPDGWIAHNNLGIIYAFSARNELALEQFKEAARVAPPDKLYGSLNNYGKMLDDMGRPAEAYEQYARALELSGNQNHNIACFNAGAELMKLGRKAEGKALLEKAFELNVLLQKEKPGDSLVVYNVGLTLKALEKYDQAIEVFEKSLKADDANPQLWLQVGTCHLALSHWGDAVAALTRAGELSKGEFVLRPLYCDAINLLARIRGGAQDAKFRDPVSAVSLSTQVCELATRASNRFPEYMDTFAIAEASSGKFKEAMDAAAFAHGMATELQMDFLAGRIQERRKLYEQGKTYVGTGAMLVGE